MSVAAGSRSQIGARSEVCGGASSEFVFAMAARYRRQFRQVRSRDLDFDKLGPSRTKIRQNGSSSG